MLKNILEWYTPYGVSRQRQCGDRVTVVGKVPGYEIPALGLLLFVPVLKENVQFPKGWSAKIPMGMLT